MNTTSQDHDQLCWAHTWLTSHADIAQVAVALIQPGESLRLKGESKDHVTSMVQAGDMPPIIVHRPTMKVIDGTHRVTAAKRQHRDTIAVRFFDGTVDEAFVLAVVANAGNGLPMTTKDRKVAATRILGIYPDWSDRMIADTTGLSHHTVAAVRRHLSTGQIAQFKRRLGKDGKTRPATARRGPGAEQTDGPSCTVHDVRARLRQGVKPSVSTTRAAGLGYSLARGQTALERLRNNPSVRSNDDGKALLRLLSNSLKFVSAAQALTRCTPEHCLNAVAELATALSDAWRRVAQELLARVRAG